MEEFLENGLELFCQDGVLLTGAPANYSQYLSTPGTLLIVEYPNSNGTKCIEWKPNDITIDADIDIQDQEWAMVNTVERRNRSLSGSSPPDSLCRSKIFRINMKEIRSFRVSRNEQKICFNDVHGSKLCCFTFLRSTTRHITSALRNGILKAVPSKDRHLFIVVDQFDNRMLENSFAELNLFPEQSTDYVWSFIKNLHNRPYETTMEALAKLTDIVSRAPELPPSRSFEEEVSEMLNNSLTQLEDATNTTTTVHSQDEYEVVAQIPLLPPRPEIPRGNPLTKEQWYSLQDPEGRIEDVDGVKQVIFRGGVEPMLRIEVWKYLLGYFPWESTTPHREIIKTQKNTEYFIMKMQWRNMSPIQENHFSDYRDRKSLIEKDVNRTDRTIPFYAGDNNPNLCLLSDILMTYVMYNFDLGYVQGMSDLLSPILCLLENEIEAFWCFVGFMDKVCSNFDMDQAGMKKQLIQLHTLLTFVEPELANYLDRHDSGNMFFCFRWLLVLFKREFSQVDIMRLWEVIWTGLPCKNFHLLLCVAILETEKSTIIENNFGFTEILKHVNDLSQNIDLQSILSKAEGIYHQITAASHLNDKIRIILGLKPVGDLDNHDSNVTSSIEEDNSIENVTMKPDLSEVAFETSLSHSYL